MNPFDNDDRFPTFREVRMIFYILLGFWGLVAVTVLYIVLALVRSLQP